MTYVSFVPDDSLYIGLGTINEVSNWLEFRGSRIYDFKIYESHTHLQFAISIHNSDLKTEFILRWSESFIPEPINPQWIGIWMRL